MNIFGSLKIGLRGEKLKRFFERALSSTMFHLSEYDLWNRFKFFYLEHDIQMRLDLKFVVTGFFSAIMLMLFPSQVPGYVLNSRFGGNGHIYWFLDRHH